MKPNLLVILGPTASGKTRLAVAAARHLDGEIISVDSRQVFRRMDIGTGKDLHEYGDLRHHLIDILEPGEEFSVFAFQRLFAEAFNDISGRSKLPVLAGGTGLYLDATLRDYDYVLSQVPENPLLREELSSLSLEDLATRLALLNKKLQNRTSLLDRDRLTRAIEIAHYDAENGESQKFEMPALHPLVFGIRVDRELMRRRITERLKQRLDEGMIEEVRQLLEEGVPVDRLESYGLEYRYVSRFVRGELRRNDMFQKLNSAIHDFAKRQENWFRRMEKYGVEINWLNHADDPLEKLLQIWDCRAS
ncbi:MAG: tRNA (adenosine(37)-N6)-dimethylallyltransferase MiaA [Geobacteraceae bacterium]|nr:tRNA (adenosine(37)-N6)-dimethylallyltransferase MiaA [Geobacteraceae bacterium]